MPQLDKFISFFHLYTQVDGRYDDLFSLFLLFLIMLLVISMMERTHSNKGKSTATTSAGGDGHNGDGDDDRKREEAYAIRQARKTEKEIASFVHDHTGGNPLFPRAPSLQDWETVIRRFCDAEYSNIPLGKRRGYVNGLFTRLTIEGMGCSRFDQLILEMIKYLSENK